MQNRSFHVQITKKRLCNACKTPVFLSVKIRTFATFLSLVINEQSWPGNKILHYAREIGHPTLMITNLSKCCGHYGQSDWPLFSRSCCVIFDNGKLTQWWRRCQRGRDKSAYLMSNDNGFCPLAMPARPPQAVFILFCLKDKGNAFFPHMEKATEYWTISIGIKRFF